MEKLIRALVIATASTIGAAIILQQLERRAGAGTDDSNPALGPDSGQAGAEIDADQIDPAQRKAMLAELEAQL